MWHIVLAVAAGAMAGMMADTPDLVLTGDALDGLRQAGAKLHDSVSAAPGRDGPAIAFSEGGIACPMAGRLSAQRGGVDLWCRTPEDWPSPARRTLFHVGAEPHVHVTLFCEGGQFRAVYKGGREHYAAIQFAESDLWEPLSWHRLQFWWDGGADEVSFFLRVDDRLVGAKRGRTVQRWPDTFFLGARGAAFEPWLGLVDDARISPASLGVPDADPVDRSIEVHADDVLGECYNFWSIRNFTSQDMFADARQRERIRRSSPFMRCVNCVRLIGGRSDGKNRFFLGVDERGEPLCDFAPLLSYLRGIMGMGCTPRIVLDNVPTAMSDPPEMHMYGNTYPPRDYDLYHAYIKALVGAMADEFGPEVVRTWRFRVMTEPDLDPGHWAGTEEEYLKLYDYAVDAVTQVIPDAHVGPGNILTPGAQNWGLDIVDHAATGTNYRTGGTGTRMTFFSCSWYGAVGEPADSFAAAVRAMRAKLDAYPQFRDLPVEVAEFAVLHDEYGRRLWGGDTTEWEGSWFAGIAKMAYDLNVRQIHQWGTTANAIATPKTHVLNALERMAAGERLRVRNEPASTSSGTLACRKGDRLFVLVYNHRPFREPKVAEHVTLTIRDGAMRAGDLWEVSESLVDAEHGVFARAFERDCEEAGIKPLPGAALYEASIGKRFGRAGAELLSANRAEYTRLAQPLTVRMRERVTADEGRITLTFDMPGHSVRFFELSRP